MKPRQRQTLVFLAVLLAITSFTAAGVFSRSQKKSQAEEVRPTNQPELVTQAPQVVSKIKGLEITGVKLINQGSSDASVVVDVVNNRDESVMCLDFVSQRNDLSGGVAVDGLLDEDHPLIVIPPHSLKSFTLSVGEVMKDSPLVLAAATFSDGKQEGDKRSLEGIRKSRERFKDKTQKGIRK